MLTIYETAIKAQADKCQPRHRLEAELELRIAAALVKSALDAGYAITVDDGDEDVIKRERDPAAIMNALFSTGRTRLYLHRPEVSVGGVPKTWHAKPFAWVKLIWGNGPDVISDYTLNVESLMTEPNAIAERYR